MTWETVCTRLTFRRVRRSRRSSPLNPSLKRDSPVLGLPMGDLDHPQTTSGPPRPMKIDLVVATSRPTSSKFPGVGERAMNNARDDPDAKAQKSSFSLSSRGQVSVSREFKPLVRTYLTAEPQGSRLFFLPRRGLYLFTPQWPAISLLKKRLKRAL